MAEFKFLTRLLLVVLLASALLILALVVLGVASFTSEDYGPTFTLLAALGLLMTICSRGENWHSRNV